jgi:hypothetical protein
MSLPSIDAAWLRAHGATSLNRTDAWGQFLDARLVSAGAMPGRRRAWLASFLIGGALPDLWHEFWSEPNAGAFP